MYRCLQCSGKTPSHFEQCPRCGGWGTAIRVKVPKPITLADIGRETGAVERFSLRPDWDLALGGGAMPGSVVLVYGPGGVGKSTDLLRLLSEHGGALAASERQLFEIEIDTRKVDDIDTRRIKPAETHTIDDVIDHFEAIGGTIFVLDSWNALADADPKRDIPKIRAAIGDGIALVICHQTKEGGLRGPETLSHAVNAVVRMQKKHLRVEKNWHGPLVRIARSLPRFKGTKKKARAKPAPRRAASRIRRAATAKPKTVRKRAH